MRSLSTPGSSATREQAADHKALTEMVAPLLLRTVLEAADHGGVDTLALCRGLGFLPGDLDVPGFMVSHFEAVTVIRRALQAIGNPALGLELGMRSNIVSRGALALGLMASATLGDALRLMLRFPASAGQLLALHEEALASQQVLQASSLFGHYDVEPFLVDKLFAGLVRLCRQGTSADYAPAAVELVRNRPADVRAYEAYYRCPVRFGSARNRLICDIRWMDSALPTASAMVLRYAIELLQREATPAKESVVVQAVARVVRQAKPQASAAAEVASSLHLSERTMRRRLMESGQSFRAMQDEQRKSRALALVLNGRLDLTQVALEVGFADVSSFRRAFKRWTGKTPSEMRDAQP